MGESDDLNVQNPLEDVDLLIAPHHGRASGRSYEFLDVLRPKLTLFGNASAEHLAYYAWNNRELPFITNNQAGCIVINADTPSLDLYITNEVFAKKLSPYAFYSEVFRAHYCKGIKPTLLSKTGRNLAAHVANGSFACPEPEF